MGTEIAFSFIVREVWILLSLFIFLTGSSLSAAPSASVQIPSRIGTIEFCRLAARVILGNKKSTDFKVQHSKFVPVDLASFIGGEMDWKMRIAERFAPLFPPALHANILYRRSLAALKRPENAGKTVFQMAHEIMGHQVQVGPSDLERIPKENSFLMISNHPTGVVDGDTDAHLLSLRGRDDFSILVAHFLETSMSSHPDLAKHFIYVDRRHRKFEDVPPEEWNEEQKKISAEADALNRRQLREMLKRQKQGQVIILYPTGSIASNLPHPEHPVAYDGAWDPTTVTMAKIMKVIVPTFKVIRNSDRYLQLKRESLQKSRKAYFAEALNKENQTVQVIVGDPFTWADVEAAVPVNTSDPRYRAGLESRKAYESEVDRQRLAFIRSKVDALDPYGFAAGYAPHN